jgi:capsid protein
MDQRQFNALVKVEKYQGLDQRIILKQIVEKWNGRGMDWIDLAQERERWRAAVNAVMNLRVPQNAGNFLSS